ncbi:MAG: AAA family ATPase [Pseudomonadota bacterium]
MSQQLSSDQISSLYERSSRLLAEMKADMPDDIASKELGLRFNVKLAAAMVGRSDATIRRAEESGELPPPKKRQTGKRFGYTLEDVNHMRDVFGTRPWRSDTDDPIVLGVQNFKGGVGKSTLAVHAAQYFALQGYRVLVIDADPQASSTAMFGVHPERDIDTEDTMLPFLAGEEPNLIHAVKPTYWDGLDIIPSCLGLYDAEYFIAGSSVDPENRFEKIRRGLVDIAPAYDIVVIDPPPALGMISINVLRATNALLIPTPPSSIDYSSTVSFLSMLTAVLRQVEGRGLNNDFKFVHLVATKVDENKSAHIGMRDAMKTVFGGDILSTALLDSAEFDNANVEMRTVYEYAGPMNSTYKRCRSNLDLVMGDLELAIRNSWPSHRRDLRMKGVA